MGRGVRYGSLRFSERDGRNRRWGEGAKGRGRSAFTSAVRILRYGRGNLRRPCASRVRESSRAHAAAPAHIRIVMATFPVVCRARRDLAARRTYVDDRGHNPGTAVSPCV